MPNLQLTRGGLTPAKVVNLSTNEEVACMFNPFEFTISKTNSWDSKITIGTNLPKVTFKNGGAQSVTLNLWFDSAESGSDVRTHTKPLWKMAMIETANKNDKSGKGSPPAVEFRWGRITFRAIITQITENFVMFAADGTPLRCKITLNLQEHLETTTEMSPAENTPSAGTTAVQGDRPDHLANRTDGDSNAMRDVMSRNNVNNPLTGVRNGTNVV
jgi:hypothetical protein